MWWSCKQLRGFGAHVHDEFQRIIGILLPLMPRVMLLLDLESDSVYGKLGISKILLAYLLTAEPGAGAVIRAGWEAAAPTRLSPGSFE